MKMWSGCYPHKTSKLLVIIGGLNWGLIGLAKIFSPVSNWNVVNWLFGNYPTIEGIVYLLVGISAIGLLISCRCKQCKMCQCSDANCNHCNKM